MNFAEIGNPHSDIGKNLILELVALVNTKKGVSPRNMQATRKRSVSVLGRRVQMPEAKIVDHIHAAEAKIAEAARLEKRLITTVFPLLPLGQQSSLSALGSEPDRPRRMAKSVFERPAEIRATEQPPNLQEECDVRDRALLYACAFPAHDGIYPAGMPKDTKIFNHGYTGRWLALEQEAC